MKKNHKKRPVFGAILSVLILSPSMLLGCGGDMYEYDEYDPEMSTDYEDYEDYEEFDPYMMDEDEYGEYDEYASEQGGSYEDFYGYYPYTKGCDPSIFGKLGSASEVEGTTVVVSIYTNDSGRAWTDEDTDLMYDMKNYLGMACEWISDQVADYGTHANFIYDWEKYEDLYYEADIDYDLVFGNASEIDFKAWDCIDNTIDSDMLMSNYSADNIIYMIFLNTPLDLEETSMARNYYEGMEYPYEICFINSCCEEEQECPAGIAHEMLHTFGAPDLYCTDDEGFGYGMSEELVRYYEDTNSNDIMFTNFDCMTDKAYYDKITNELSEIDAYYIGITDHSDVATEWGLLPSQHEQ